jgi:membrane protein DedA with SNARE-associated domain
VVGLAVFFFAISLVGDSLLSYLVDRHPAWFIALNSRNRNLVLAKPYLDWWTFFGIGLVRLLVSDPLFFLLGRWYGDAGVRWIEHRSPTYGPMARAAERFFGKAAYPLVAIAPNNYVCLFAGAGGMSLPVFFALNIGGTVVRLVLLWFASDVVEAPLDWVRELITENRLPVLVLSVAVVGVTLWMDQRSGGTEVGGLLHIDEEIAEEEAEIAAEEATEDGGGRPAVERGDA